MQNFFDPYGYPAGFAPQTPPMMPYGQPGAMMQSALQRPTQVPAAPQQPNLPVVMQVPTIKHVEQTQVQPGGRALILVANEPVVAMRVADNMGLTTTDYYQLTHFDPNAVVPGQETGDFVTRAELRQTLESFAAQYLPAPASATTAEKKEGSKK